MTTRGRGYIGRRRDDSSRPGDERTETLPSEEAKKFRENKPLRAMETKINSNLLLDQEDEELPRDTEDQSLKELLQIDDTYTPLLVLLEQFTPGEDGIQFNRKLRHFETTINNMCPDEPRLFQAFAAFRAAALTKASMARKLATVGASFTRQQKQQVLRIALLNIVMQGVFAKLDVLERSNPQYLINASNLMGDYFAEARLCNGEKVHILASPLLKYLKSLLKCDDVRAHRTLAAQLMLNGRELWSMLSSEMDEFAITIRLRLFKPPPVNAVWLVLCSDLSLNKYQPLPQNIQQFYAAQLNLSAEEENYSEVNYGAWKNTPEKDFNQSDPNISAESLNQSINQLSFEEDSSDSKPKLRPILGAGARLLKNTNLNASQDNYETWTKSNLSKRYDLNSWRQNGEENEEEIVFNPSVKPPPIPQLNNVIPDYPNGNPKSNQEVFVQNYGQGDGKYVQNQINVQQNKSNTLYCQGDGAYISQNIENDSVNVEPSSMQNEIQKPKRPVENWRKDKSEETPKDEKLRPKTWKQISKDSINDESVKEEKSDRSSSKSKESRPTKKKEDNTKRRHVTDVPRSQKYWDHDDRCDKDYNS